METLIVIYTFASIMWVAGAFFVAWFIDEVVDFFIALISAL